MFNKNSFLNISSSLTAAIVFVLLYRSKSSSYLKRMCTKITLK